MMGMTLHRGLFVGVLALTLALGACKKGKDTSTAVDEKNEPPPPSGSMDGTVTEATLENTRWALLDLRGSPIVTETEDRTPYLELNPTKVSAYGFGGCNRFFGSYEATDQSLKFGAMGATRMACPTGMQQEQELFTVLAATTRYEIDGSKLLLFAGETLLARFEARDVPPEP